MERPADRLTTVIVTVSNQSWRIAKAKQNTPNLRLKFSPFNSYCCFFFLPFITCYQFLFQFFIVSCIYEQNKVAKTDSGAHQTFSWLWSWSKWLPYDVTMFPSQSVSFPRKQISSCRQCWLLTQFFKQKNILNAVNSFCWFDKGYSGIIPESQNVFPSYPGFVIRVACHVIRMIPSTVVDCLGYQTACSGEVQVK